MLSIWLSIQNILLNYFITFQITLPLEIAITTTVDLPTTTHFPKHIQTTGYGCGTINQKQALGVSINENWTTGAGVWGGWRWRSGKRYMRKGVINLEPSWETGSTYFQISSIKSGPGGGGGKEHRIHNGNSSTIRRVVTLREGGKMFHKIGWKQQVTWLQLFTTVFNWNCPQKVKAARCSAHLHPPSPPP